MTDTKQGLVERLRADSKWLAAIAKDETEILSTSDRVDYLESSELMLQAAAELARSQESLAALREVARLIYFAGYWHCDRPVDEAVLWKALRDAVGIEPGQTEQLLGEDRAPLVAAELARSQESLAHLKEIEFVSSGYCPACSGWEVTKGQGCERGVHTKTCWLRAALEGEKP